jgi:hypothetical protein
LIKVQTDEADSPQPDFAVVGLTVMAADRRVVAGMVQQDSK